jgi:acetylornithine/N-succinyldiaminopimelate aminotransferase
MAYEKILENQEKYILPTYGKIDTMLVKGAGPYVWDSLEKKYIDFTCGIGVCNIGHCHNNVTEAMADQASKLVHVSNLFVNEKQPVLAEKLIKNTFKGKVFFSNSGAEANEGMIKFARKWGNNRNRNTIITMKDSFHGRTLATLSATGRVKYRIGFEPEVSGFAEVPFNDFDALLQTFKEAEGKISAILMEPILGEGGIIPADKEYIKNVREFCNENEILLMFDEVQTGIGRTGELFAYKHYGVEPDLLSMAKGLGNGFPIGAFIVNNSIENVLTAGTHASTFGGTPLACSAAIAVLDTIENENLLVNCRNMGEFLKNKFADFKRKFSSIKEIRGEGLMIGIAFDINTSDILSKAKNAGLLLIPAGENVIRFYPPINITKEVLEEALNIFENVLKSILVPK